MHPRFRLILGVTGSLALWCAGAANAAVVAPAGTKPVGPIALAAGPDGRALVGWWERPTSAPGVVHIALGLYRASRAGEFSAVDPTLERLLGRRPTTMRDFLARTNDR